MCAAQQRALGSLAFASTGRMNKGLEAQPNFWYQGRS